MRQMAFVALTGVVAALVAPFTHAQQSGTAALTAQLKQVCAGAATGSALASRCSVIMSSPDPNAIANAANMNDLEEIPGAGRGQANDQWPSRGEFDAQLTPKLALFASVDHGHSFRSDDNIEASFDAESTTFTVGMDWNPVKRWQLGVALDHLQDDQQFRGSVGRTESKITGVLAVSSYDLNDNFVLDGYVGRGEGSQDVRRGVGFIDNSPLVLESASPDLARSLGGVALDATFPHGSLQFLGSLGLDAARTSINGYTEQGGSGFDLIVPDRAIQTDRGRLEVGLADSVSESWGVWQPGLRVGLIHEFSNDEHLVGVRFVDDTNGTVVHFDTGAPDRDWEQATLSSSFTLAHGNSGFITVSREFNHSTSTATTYAIGWRVEL